MARLYRYKDDPTDFYLNHPFNGNVRHIHCNSLADQLFDELDYEAGIKSSKKGEKIPANLMWALWETGLIYSGDNEEQDVAIGRSIEEGKQGETVPLGSEDIDILRDLIERYTGGPKRTLQEVAKSLGLTLDADSTISTPTSSSGDHKASDQQRFSNVDLTSRLTDGGVHDITTPEAFREWYGETVDGPPIEQSLTTPKTTRALTFLSINDGVSSVQLSGLKDTNKHIRIEASVESGDYPQIEADLINFSFGTGSGFLPPENKRTGAWEMDYLTAYWTVESRLPTKSDEILKIQTSIDLTSAGISTVHSDVWNGTGHFEEDFLVRNHQTEIVVKVLQRHIESPGPFSLPKERTYSEYPCAVDFRTGTYLE